MGIITIQLWSSSVALKEAAEKDALTKLEVLRREEAEAEATAESEAKDKAEAEAKAKAKKEEANARAKAAKDLGSSITDVSKNSKDVLDKNFKKLKQKPDNLISGSDGDTALAALLASG